MFPLGMMIKTYSPKIQGIWETKANMTTGRYGLTAAVSGQNVYNQVWETKANMTTGRYGLTAAVI